MRKLGLLAIVLMVSAGSFAQAAAEGALVHSLSTSMGTAVGKALGNATNQAATRVGGQLGQQTSRTTPRAAVTRVKPPLQNQKNQDYGTTPEPPSGGTLIQSIQGAKLQPTCSPAPNADAKSADSGQQAPPARTAEAPCASGNNAYQSVIILPAPK